VIYECRGCGLKEPRGILPCTTCGLFLIVMMTVFLAPGVVWLKVWFPGGLGWWWVIAVPGLVVFSFIGAFLLDLVASIVEWVGVSLFACKKCKSHRYRFGRTEGFGL
jgi:hypothetical protein